MKANYQLEEMATIINDKDDKLPKGRSRCFDIGIHGGCGVYCAAFVDGECESWGYITNKEIIEAHGEVDGAEIIWLYRANQVA